MNTVPHCKDRRSPRRDVDLPCQAVAEEGFRLLGDRVLDLSPEGMMLSVNADSDAEVKVGESVIVTFRAPRSEDWIDAEAVVARVIRGERATDKGRAVGLRFVKQDPVDAILLRARLSKLAPRVPDRNLRRDYAAFVRSVDFLSPSNLRRSGFDYLRERVN